MKRIMLFWALLMMAFTASAHLNDILGEWKTVDDKTGNNYSIISIYQGEDGLIYGKVAKMLMGPKDLRCEACKGDDHNALLEGLMIIRGMSYSTAHDELTGGKVLDPESGKFYYGKIYPKDGKLVLRGSIDRFSILGRNQTWIRR